MPAAQVDASGGERLERLGGRGQSASPHSNTPKITAAEVSRGELPSLREIKTRARCGTDRARVIRDELAEILQEAPEAA